MEPNDVLGLIVISAGLEIFNKRSQKRRFTFTCLFISNKTIMCLFAWHITLKHLISATHSANLTYQFFH